VQEWKGEKGDTILRQLEDLGASLDWEKTQFTLSPKFSNSVNHAFMKLFNKGIIYRKESLVNWSCVLQSTISDIEVNHVEVDTRTHFDVPGYKEPVEFGVMTDIAYKVTNSAEEILISTTRPETLLGDTAVAVNPTDSRYSHLIGQTVWHPFRQVELPIIADSYVDAAFGTGAVKITPAHDLNDFEIGVRHSLSSINIFNGDGTVNINGGEFAGLHRFEVRELICERLEDLGLYRGDKDHAMSIPVCGRTGDIIEPILKYQWFVSTSKMSELASLAVKDNDLRLDPPAYDAVWENFMGKDKTRDWCISRQLWWGHRIPAWFCYKSGEESSGVWIAADSETSALDQAKVKLGCDADSIICEQDPDVLDTWFSSGIYPFAAFGWPENTSDLSKFFPLDLMETGHDILFFWVARMVMLSIALMGKLPFEEVLLHGIICDSQGRKMSKSLGNVIDPMHIIHGATLEQLKQELEQSARTGVLSAEEASESKKELASRFPKGIKASGADPLRWALLSFDVKGQQINLDVDLVVRAGAWCNKIWQVNRLLDKTHQLAAESGKSLSALPKDFQPSLMDMWILNQLAHTVGSVNEHFQERDLHNVLKDLRSFLYGDVCDVYVEYIKPHLQNPEDPKFLPCLLFLHTVLLSSLKMMHPIMPFITEELYQRLPKMPNERRKESIMLDSYPQAVEWSGFVNPALSDLVEVVLKMASGLRGIRSNYTLLKGSNPAAVIHCGESVNLDDIKQFSEVIQRLGRCGEISFVADKPDLTTLAPGCAVNTIDDITVALHLGDCLDAAKEIKKLQEKIAKNGRDRVKAAKGAKGAFKYRDTPEKIAEKLEGLDAELAEYQYQLKTLEQLLQQQQQS